MTEYGSDAGGMLSHNDVLCWLAENPALPPHLLERFIAVADEELCDEVASRDDLTPRHVAALAKRGARDKLIGEGKVPIGDIPRDDPRALLAALHRDDTPSSWATELATHPDAKFRNELPELVPNRVDVMSSLVDDPDVDVVSEVALWAMGLPETDMRRLYSRRDCVIRDALARNEQTPADILAELLANGGSPVVDACGACRSEPAAVRRARCGGHDAAVWRVRTAALHNPATPVGDMTDFLASDEPWVREALAKRVDRTGDLHDQLAVDPEPMVRGAIAKNPLIPVRLMRQLAVDEDPQVRRSVIENSAIPLDLLSQLAARVRHSVDVLPRIAAASLDEIRELAASPVTQVRALAAAREDLPGDMLTAFLDDPDAGVVKRALADPRVTTEQLRAVLHRHGFRVMPRVARHASCPPDVLDHVAEHGKRAQPSALRDVAKHPAAPTSAVLECLDVPNARHWAARHPALPGDVVASLLDDPEWTVRAAAAANPSLPVPVIEHLLGVNPTR